MDLKLHRCMLAIARPAARRARCELIVGYRRWEGRAGSPIASLPERRAWPLESPVWLVDLLRGVEEAQVTAEDVLGGHAWRRFSAHANLGRADKAVAYAMTLPPSHKLEVENAFWGDFERIPVEVWVDDEHHVRRIHTDGGLGMFRATIDLTEFETGRPLDWSRLPTFAQIRDAARLPA